LLGDTGASTRGGTNKRLGFGFLFLLHGLWGATQNNKAVFLKKGTFFFEAKKKIITNFFFANFYRVKHKLEIQHRYR